MKFRFKLESVLKLRAHEETAETQKLAVLIHEENVLQKELERRIHQLQCNNQQKNLQTRLAYEKMAGSYALIESRSLNELRQRISEKQQETEQQRRRVHEANKKLRIIQKLKKKALVEHLKELGRQEQLFQNEIATQMYYRQQK